MASLTNLPDSLCVNEIAPRPHNSGHYTIEACPTMSQYKSQLLSILGVMPSIPDNNISMVSPSAVMLNILGGAHPNSHNPLLAITITLPNAALHMYGKASKPGRKIGHVTVIGSSMPSVETSIAPLVSLVDSIRAERKSPTTVVTSHPETQLPKYLGAPIVAITMGSDSDLPILKPGIAVLRDFGIPFSVNITSAHRTPARMTAFAEKAASSGYRVIIAAAGGAAHLPGMVAASTALPVIGVPVKGSTLDGMDSLLSIAQMPRGVPVATVAINNSVNAALLAVRILGANDARYRVKMEAYQQEMHDGVLEKAGNLNLLGWEKYGEKR